MGIEPIRRKLFWVWNIRSSAHPHSCEPGVHRLRLGVPKDDYDRETMEKIIEILTANEENGKRFLENYRILRTDFELLGPDEVKLANFSDYKWITAIYAYYNTTVLRTPANEATRYAQRYFRKTLNYVYKSTELENFQKQLPQIAFDSDYIRNLEAKVKSRKERAANIVFALNRFVLVDRTKNPVVESLTEKVERILALWRQRTKDYGKIYSEGVQVIEEINKLQSRQREIGFSDLQYSILLTLEDRFPDDENLAKDVKELTEGLAQHTFKGWYLQQSARKNVEREVRRFLRRYIRRHSLRLDELDSLFGKMMERVYDYGTEV